MGKPRLTDVQIEQIVNLRKTGHSLNEIKKISGRANDTVFKYIKGVKILPEFVDVLRFKQGGSKNRCLEKWQIAKEKAKNLFSKFGRKEKLVALACLYWGEGNKKELNLINGDPYLIRFFIECLKEIGIGKDLLKITIRIYEDVNKNQAVKFWADFLGLPENKISNVNILKGKKVGKLKHGMCRVRVKKGAEYFKLIISMIDLMKSST